MEAAARLTGRPLIRNSKNLGIAVALTQAARLAKAEGFDWLATFDQDSLAPPGALAGMLHLAKTFPKPNRIGVVALSHRDRAAGRDYHQGWEIIEETPRWRSVRTTITSGSLIQTAIFDRVGFFEDRLFIDSVDHEFCLRCRRHGFFILEDPSLVMYHNIGSVTNHKFLWRSVVCTNHSPDRRYYITRNRLEVCTRYLTNDFHWAFYGLFDLFRASVTVLLFETERVAKFEAMLAGVRDYVFRRFGPRPGQRGVGSYIPAPQP